MALVVSVLAVDWDFRGSNPTPGNLFLVYGQFKPVSVQVSWWSVRVRVVASLVIWEIPNKFYLRYTTVFLESCDWRSPSIPDLDTTWQSLSHSLPETYVARKTCSPQFHKDGGGWFKCGRLRTRGEEKPHADKADKGRGKQVLFADGLVRQSYAERKQRIVAMWFSTQIQFDC